MRLPAAQTEHFKGMIESANRRAAKQVWPPAPGAAPGTFVIVDDEGKRKVTSYAHHAINADERRRIGPLTNGSVVVPIYRGIPRAVYRDTRCKLRRSGAGKPPQVRKPNVVKHLRRELEAHV